MKTLKLQGTITSEGKLHVNLPDNVTTGPVDVIILINENQQKTTGISLEDFINKLYTTPRAKMTKEEIDQFLDKERDSWE